MHEAPRSDVLDLEDEALLQKLKDEGLAARFYGPKRRTSQPVPQPHHAGLSKVAVRPARVGGLTPNQCAIARETPLY